MTQKSVTKTAPDMSLTTPKDRSSPLLKFIREEAPEAGSVTQIDEGVCSP